MSRDIVSKLTNAIMTVVSQPDTKEMLGKDGVEAEYMGPDKFGKFIAAEVVKWGKVVKAGGVKAE